MKTTPLGRTLHQTKKENVQVEECLPQEPNYVKDLPTLSWGNGSNKDKYNNKD